MRARIGTMSEQGEGIMKLEQIISNSLYRVATCTVECTLMMALHNSGGCLVSKALR